MSTATASSVDMKASMEACRAYLDAIIASKTPQKRGRPLSKERIEEQLAEATKMYKTTHSSIRKLSNAAKITDLKQRLRDMDRVEEIKTVNPDDFVAEFISIGGLYASERQIPAAAFRFMGVPARVLRDAGIS